MRRRHEREGKGTKLGSRSIWVYEYAPVTVTGHQNEIEIEDVCRLHCISSSTTQMALSQVEEIFLQKTPKQFQ